MFTSGGGQKWCILDDGDARGSKKAPFFRMSWYIEDRFSKNEGTYMGDIEIGQVTYMGPFFYGIPPLGAIADHTQTMYMTAHLFKKWCFLNASSCRLPKTPLTSLWYSSVGKSWQVGTRGSSGGGGNTGFWGDIYFFDFFKYFFAKKGFFGGCFCRENRLFGKLL